MSRCENPVIIRGSAFPCQKCDPCLVNRVRVWTHRIMLEATQYEDNCFATLTYDDEHLPRTLKHLPTLAPEHLRDFNKRLRKRVAVLSSTLDPLGTVRRFRFYGVGEYGPTTQRPHYHVAYFNFPTCVRGRTRRLPGSDRPVWRGCCSICEMVGETWGFGNIDLGMLETDSAKYVAQYCTKKLTRRSDPRLDGREPEFGRMSNRPGIGAPALWELASEILRLDLHTREGDVPVTLRHGSKQLPLGRYLRRKLRAFIGQEENTPEKILALIDQEMSLLRERQFSRKGRVSLSSIYKEENKGSIARFHSRQQLFSKGNRHL